MVTTIIMYIIFLMIVSATRLMEMQISRRNASWAFKNGGLEVGKTHFKFMVVLHTAFICSCGIEVLFTHRPFIPALGYPMIGLAISAQIIRFYTISVLGKFWNARVIFVPEQPVITHGLYQYIRHPNYLAVIVEIFALPMIHTAWITAIFFSILNAWMLTVRIRSEEQALSEHCRYMDSFKCQGRFLPSFHKEQKI